MKNNWKISAFALALTLLPLPHLVAEAQSNNPVCDSDYCVPPQIKIDQNNLNLIGSKLFKFLFMRVYGIAFYMDETSKPAQSYKDNVAKRLTLSYFRDIKSSDIIKAADKMLGKQEDVNVPNLQSRLNDLNAVYQSVKEGDVYTITFLPERGTTFALNGSEKITIPGKDFADAYFGIWLHSEKPIDSDLRDSLLAKILVNP